MADTAVTLTSARVSPISVQGEASFGCNTKFTIPYTDIKFGAGTTDTVTVTLGALPAKFLIDKAFVNVTTAFAGSGGLALIVGQTDDDASIGSVSVLTAGVKGLAGGAVAAQAGSTGVATQTMKAIFTNSVSGSPSALSAGSLDIYLNILDTSKLP